MNNNLTHIGLIGVTISCWDSLDFPTVPWRLLLMKNWGLGLDFYVTMIAVL